MHVHKCSVLASIHINRKVREVKGTAKIERSNVKALQMSPKCLGLQILLDPWDSGTNNADYKISSLGSVPSPFVGYKHVAV